MKASSEHPTTTATCGMPCYTGLLVFFTLVSALAISNESLWIDEICTAHFAGQPSLREVWLEMLRANYPELQAPLFMAYAWGWQTLFGASEWVLRAAGAPWFIIGAALFAGAFRDVQKRIWAALAIGISPFIWSYLNEARLYSVQIGIVLALFASLVHLKNAEEQREVPPRGWLALLCVSSLCLSLVSILGMVWTIAVFVGIPCVFSWRTIRSWFVSHWLLLGGALLAFVPCALYYLWTQGHSPEPTRVGRTDWRILLFVAYELFGFNGLGPGRLALREAGMSALKPWMPLLAVYGGSAAVVAFAALRHLRAAGRLRLLGFSCLALLVPFMFFLAVAVLTDFRILGRHCAPLILVPICLVLTGLFQLWNSGVWWQKGMTAAFLLLVLFSCLAQRFASRHAKDDYRNAAEFAKSKLAANQVVWWNADPRSCSYYRVPITEEVPLPGKVWYVLSPAEGFEAQRERPDWVIASKPDVYDRTGNLRQFLSRENYALVHTLPAFRIYARPNLETPGASPSRL